MSFIKDLAKPPPEINDAYRVLEQIIEEEGTVNPYAQLLFPTEQIQEEDFQEYTEYYRMNVPNQTINNAHMEEWSILSTRISYPQHSRSNTYLHVQDSPNQVDQWSKDFNKPILKYQGCPKTTLMQDYLDCYEEVHSYLHLDENYDDNKDVTTTYLGTEHIYKTDIFNPEPSVPIYSNSHTWGQVVGGNMLNILIDTGAAKCYMSKNYYDKNPALHKLLKFKTKVLKLQVGNGAQIKTHFVIPIQLKIQQHRFEIYTLVANIEDSIDMVLGMKNMHELEAEHSSRHSEFRIMNRAIPMFPMENFTLKPGNKRFVKFIVPFFSNLTGKTIVKLTIGPTVITAQCTLKDNLGVIDMVNTSSHPFVFTDQKAFGIVDIRSLGYYNIRHSTLQYNLSTSNYHHMAPVHSRHDKTRTPKQTCKQHVRPRSADADRYPWLDEKDPRRNMTDEEILDTYIDLSKSSLTQKDKEALMSVVKTHKKAFSLRDEIGNCPNIKIDIDVIDESPFFVRPFHISEDDKPIMDWQMQRLVSLGILTRNTTSHTSPVMLITRKITRDKRPVVDFRLLNTRIRRHNTATPLLRDIYQMLGKSHSEILTCVDLKDAFHSLKLTDKAKDYCGILPYFGSPHYRYEVMPMGLSISPCKWIQYIGIVMEKLPHPENYIAIMDDLLVHSKKKDHLDRITDMLEALITHGLKLSPKKCQFFMEELVYMGNIFRISKKGIFISPIKSRVEAIMNTPSPTTPKECKSFCGVVNYLSIFCPHLQKLLGPIYDLTRKGRPFVWTEEHEKNFKIIKKQLASAPVLTLPNGTGRYILYSDTSKTHTGSALWQIQNGKPRLIGYASKSLPSACANYGITELEMTGLLYNMNMWKYYLGKKDFDAAVDHAAIPHIMKSKNLPATDRIIRLLEALSFFTFHLYYVKGKDMILCDFLSRIQVDQGDPMDLVPITYNCYAILQEAYKILEENYLILTRSQRAQAGLPAPPRVHGASKGVNPDLKPETQARKQTFHGPSQAPPPHPCFVSALLKTQRNSLDPPNKNKTLHRPPAPLNSQVSTSQDKNTRSHTSGSSSDLPATFDPRPPVPDQRVQVGQTQQQALTSTTSGTVTTKQIKTPINIAEIEAPCELDPQLEIPFHETSVEAMFAPPDLKDFIIPPSLG